MSRDGTTLIGRTGNSFFRWTAEGGMTISDTLSDAAWGEVFLSGDGMVVASSGFVNSATRAFRWMPGQSPTLLGEIPGGTEGSSPLGISFDGATIVGWGNSAGGLEAMRWTEATGMKGLGDLPGGDFFGSAISSSDNGLVVVGTSRSDQGVWDPSEPFIWTPNAGIRRMADVFATEEVTGIGNWDLIDTKAVSKDGSSFWGWGGMGITTRFWYVDLGAPPNDPVGAATIEGFVDGIWSEDTSWSGGVVPKPTDHWLHNSPGGDGVHAAKMHGAHEVQDFTWTSSDTLNFEGWPQNWRLGNFIVNGTFHLGDGTIHTTIWDPRVIFNGPVNLSGGVIGNTDGASEGGEFFFADNTELTFTGATWVFGRQYDPEHSQFRSHKTAVTWGKGSINLDGVGLNEFFTVHMLGDTQTEGNAKNVFTRNLTGRGGLRKTGPGKFILQAMHEDAPLVYDYERQTLVDEGEFQIDGVLTKSQVELKEGAKISGTGSIWGLVGKGEIGGSLTVTDRFAPNDSSIGQFSFSGTSLTLKGQVRMDLPDFDPALADRVTSSSGGSLNLDGATLALLGSNWTVGQVFTLFTGFSEVIGTFAETADGTVLTAPVWDAVGYALRVNYHGDGVTITVVAPPKVTGGFADFLNSLPGGQSGTTDNGDNDPWPNIFEYLFGLDPNAPDGQVVDSLLSEDNGEPCMILTFPLKQGTSGAFITVEKSEDLTGWTTIWDSSQDPNYQSAAVVSIETIEGKDLVSIKIPAPQNEAACFARIAGSLSE